MKPSRDLSPRSKRWHDNGRALARKIMRTNLNGKEGLQYVLLEILKA